MDAMDNGYAITVAAFIGLMVFFAMGILCSGWIKRMLQ